ncbi:hypothetical protein EDD18DRAFT_496545 [Armillaria luteobubalina]|uniref:Uncharacterized protein n=1 Tax=Armillaria luteobubalina TaxID=153913 RepID=A0AA39QJZ3_9AGAR|nr:hypothetical protein EDD18DRAFT_496545 [Armillaria luteobubalina]
MGDWCSSIRTAVSFSVTLLDSVIEPTPSRNPFCRCYLLLPSRFIPSASDIITRTFKTRMISPERSIWTPCFGCSCPNHDISSTYDLHHRTSPHNDPIDVTHLATSNDYPTPGEVSALHVIIHDEKNTSDICTTKSLTWLTYAETSKCRYHVSTADRRGSLKPATIRSVIRQKKRNFSPPSDACPRRSYMKYFSLRLTSHQRSTGVKRAKNGSCPPLRYLAPRSGALSGV